jgi:hypothetical protein
VIENVQPDPPIGADGPDADRDQTTGKFRPGNKAALIVGHRSTAFWTAHASALQEIAAATIADAGHTQDDAPRALRLAADGIAQASLLRDSAFLRVVESGGPLTSSGRTRRAFAVWMAASDRLEKHLRLVGLKRIPKPAPSLDAYLKHRYATQDATPARPEAHDQPGDDHRTDGDGAASGGADE